MKTKEGKKTKEYKKDVLTIEDIAYMMDPGVLKLNTSVKDVEVVVEACKKYDFGSCFCRPCYYPQLVGMLKGTNTAFGTSLAFPSGQEATGTEVYLARKFMKLNPTEGDMMMSVDYLKARQYDLVLEDIRAVHETTKGASLKVVIEAMVLADDEVRKACELTIEGGVDYVKSGTGFSRDPATLHHVEVMKETVGDRTKIRVAGGVRDLDTMLEVCRRGACRFGVGFTSTLEIIKRAIAVDHGIDMSTID